MKNKRLISVLVTILLLISYSVPALASNKKVSLDEIMAKQKNLKEFVYQEFDMRYQKEGIDLSKANVKREIIINKINDKKAIEKSFYEPVVIYKEKLTIEPEVGTLGTISRVYDGGGEVMTYHNASISCNVRVEADRQYSDLNGELFPFYKLAIYDAWWSTNNQFTGADGGGCYQIDSIVDQQGQDLNGDYRVVIDENFSTDMDERETMDSFKKIYSPSYYSATTNEGYAGVAGTLTTFKCIFGAGPGLTYTYDSGEIHAGWGALPT